MTEKQVEEQVAEATERLRAATARREELARRIEQARAAVNKAEAYHKVMNLMSAHVHCCLNQDYALELDRYWSKRDDIVYANGDLAYVGQEAVRRYYVEGAKARTAEACRSLGQECQTEGDKTPGYKNMNLIGTPYVEVAEDGQTAQGIWMAHSFQGRVDENGRLVTQGVLSRYSGEFILEDGEWKIWHRRNYADVVFEEDPAAMFDLPPAEDGKPREPMVVNPLPTTLTRIHAPGGDYGPASLPVGEPKLPEPYDTWREETSNVRKEGAF